MTSVLGMLAAMALAVVVIFRIAWWLRQPEDDNDR